MVSPVCLHTPLRLTH